MILFTLLLLAGIIAGIIAIFVVGVGGIAFTMVFGDVLVFAAIIALAIRCMTRRSRKKEKG